jgi:hypothetical protein
MTDYMRLLEDNLDTINVKTKTINDASRKVGLEINIKKTRYMLEFQSWYMKIANRSFENVSQFIYLGITVRNQYLIQDKIKIRLNPGNASYHSVQNLLSSCLLSKHVKIRIYKTIILLVVLYGCETWSLTLREEYRLRVFENRVLRRISGPKRDEVAEGYRKNA